MISNFIPENLPNFLDLRIKIIDTFGFLNAALVVPEASVFTAEEDEQPRQLGIILAHQGGLLLRLEENWAGLNLEDLQPATEAYYTRAKHYRPATIAA